MLRWCEQVNMIDFLFIIAREYRPLALAISSVCQQLPPALATIAFPPSTCHEHLPLVIANITCYHSTCKQLLPPAFAINTCHASPPGQWLSTSQNELMVSKPAQHSSLCSRPKLLKQFAMKQIINMWITLFIVGMLSPSHTSLFMYLRYKLLLLYVYDCLFSRTIALRDILPIFIRSLYQ